MPSRTDTFDDNNNTSIVEWPIYVSIIPIIIVPINEFEIFRLLIHSNKFELIILTILIHHFKVDNFIMSLTSRYRYWVMSKVIQGVF